MDPLLEQYLALTTPEAQAEYLAGLAPEDLEALRVAMRGELDGIDAEAPTDDELAQMQALAAGLRSIAAAQTAAAEAETARTAQAQALRDEVAALDEPAASDTPAEDAEPELDADGNPVTPAEPEAPAESEAAAPVPVAAAAPAAPVVAPVRAVARRTPPQRTPDPTPASAPLVASADVPGHAMGQPLTTSEQVGVALLSRYRTIKNARGNDGEKVVVASSQGSMPDARWLGEDPNTNTRRIQAVLDEVAPLAASGGICAPEQVRYNQEVMGRTDRPVRDQFMVNFGADRGGVMWVPNPRLLDVSGANPAAVDTWTAANDANPSDPATKPCAVFTCPEPSTAVIEAITRCLQFGNFMERTFRERVDAFITLANVWHARYAEQALIAAINTGSTAITTGQGLGATSDILVHLDRAVQSWRSYERLPDTVRFQWLAPQWVLAMIRTDLARSMPFGTQDERFAVADATIDRWFNLRGIDPVWSPDMQVFGAQAAGTLAGWASTIISYLAPRGTWAFLDGGELNLGLVRDSTLNETNDFQMFMETFEGAAKFGNQSWKLTMDVCPDGTAQALADVDFCTTGS